MYGNAFQEIGARLQGFGSVRSVGRGEHSMWSTMILVL